MCGCVCVWLCVGGAVCGAVYGGDRHGPRQRLRCATAHHLRWGCTARAQVADVVTEIFTDNEHVDTVQSASINLFIDNIRKAGRKPQYVDFLSVLCRCNGRAVRTNQVCDWCVIGVWSACGWCVIGVWLVCDWCVIGV